MLFRQLKYFLKVIELGGITRAAESLHIAQPALSQQISKLEDKFGTRLLIRSSKGIAPTENGRILYRHANIILQQLEQAELEMRAGDESPGGHVCIGLPGSVAMTTAVPLLKEIKERLPNVLLEIREENNDVLTEMLQNGRLDVALLYHDNAFKGVRVEPFMRERLFLVFRPDPPFFVPDEPPVTVAQLAQIPLILPAANAPKRQMIDAVCRSQDLTLQVVAETAAISTTVAAVRAGIGAAILSWSAVAPSLEAGELEALSIEQPRFSRAMSICTPDSQPASRAASEVAQIIKTVVGDMIRNGSWREAELLAES